MQQTDLSIPEIFDSGLKRAFHFESMLKKKVCSESPIFLICITIKLAQPRVDAKIQQKEEKNFNPQLPTMRKQISLRYILLLILMAQFLKGGVATLHHVHFLGVRGVDRGRLVDFDPII